MKKEDLILELSRCLYKINATKQLREDVEVVLTNRGYSIGQVAEMLSNDEHLATLSYIDLGVLADVLYTEFQFTNVSLKKFFNDIEIKEIKRYKELPTKDNKLSYPLSFKNFFQISRDKWIGYLPAKEVSNLLKSRILKYNYQTQRNPKFQKTSHGLIQRPNLNNDSIIAIKDELLKGIYVSDLLTFNMLEEPDANGNFPVFNYNDNNNTLTIQSASLDLVDGMHRAKAIELALLSNPNLDVNFPIMITNFNVDKARQYILQTDKRNPLQSEFKKSLDLEDMGVAVTNMVNENSKSDLMGRIVTDEFLINNSDGLYLLSTFSSTINALWDIKSRSQANRVADYIVSFMNELMSLYEEDFFETTKKTNINHKNAIIIFLAIAKNIEKSENWKEKLLSILTEVDMDNEKISNLLSIPITDKNIKKVIKAINLNK